MPLALGDRHVFPNSIQPALLYSSGHDFYHISNDRPADMDKIDQRLIYSLLAITFVAAGALMPTGWYDALPTRDGMPEPPIRGVVLLQLSFVLEGAIFAWLAFRRWTFTPLAPAARLVPMPLHDGDGPSRKTALWLLFGITGLALLLRFYHIGSDLWLDEITPIQDYGHLSPLAVIGSYMSTNNHLLNTLLVQLSMTIFGESEWSVRLPAVLFGVASVPVMYWISRLALTRWESLGAAALLATSYHHIFFSQNARGYSAYIFFSLVATALLIDGLQRDRWKTWLLYGLSIFLGFAALLNTAFVVGSHAIVGGVAMVKVHRRGSSPWPLFRRLFGVFAVTGILVFQLYATVLPRAYAFITTTYTGRGTGFSLFNGAFFVELFRGISAGFGPGLMLGAVPFMLVVGFGFLVLWRRSWILTLSLVLPLVLTAFYLIVQGLTFSPRFFILGLPLAMMVVVPALGALVELIGSRVGLARLVIDRTTAGLVLVTLALSLTSLGRYYSVPKQPYRASLKYLVSHLEPGGIVIVIYNAERGYQYYAPRYGLQEGKNTFYVRSVEKLDKVMAEYPHRQKTLVLTFPRSLHFFSPALEDRIQSGWMKIRTFPASVGDGQISLWREKP